jgi:hypothetical protein
MLLLRLTMANSLTKYWPAAYTQLTIVAHRSPQRLLYSIRPRQARKKQRPWRVALGQTADGIVWRNQVDCSSTVKYRLFYADPFERCASLWAFASQFFPSNGSVVTFPIVPSSRQRSVCWRRAVIYITEDSVLFSYLVAVLGNTSLIPARRLCQKVAHLMGLDMDGPHPSSRACEIV